jgi:hypothetical protein
VWSSVEDRTPLAEKIQNLYERIIQKIEKLNKGNRRGLIKYIQNLQKIATSRGFLPLHECPKACAPKPWLISRFMYDGIPCVHTAQTFDVASIPQILPMPLSVDVDVMPVVEPNPFAHWKLEKKDEQPSVVNQRKDDAAAQIEAMENDGPLQMRFIRLASMCLKALPVSTHTSLYVVAQRLQNFYLEWKAFKPYESPGEIEDEAKVFAKFSFAKLKAASKNDRDAIHLYGGE